MRLCPVTVGLFPNGLWSMHLLLYSIRTHLPLAPCIEAGVHTGSLTYTRSGGGGRAQLTTESGGRCGVCVQRYILVYQSGDSCSPFFSPALCRVLYCARRGRERGASRDCRRLKTAGECVRDLSRPPYRPLFGASLVMTTPTPPFPCPPPPPWTVSDTHCFPALFLPSPLSRFPTSQRSRLFYWQLFTTPFRVVLGGGQGQNLVRPADKISCPRPRTSALAFSRTISSAPNRFSGAKPLASSSPLSPHTILLLPSWTSSALLLLLLLPLAIRAGAGAVCWICVNVSRISSVPPARATENVSASGQPGDA